MNNICLSQLPEETWLVVGVPGSGEVKIACMSQHPCDFLTVTCICVTPVGEDAQGTYTSPLGHVLK